MRSSVVLYVSLAMMYIACVWGSGRTVTCLVAEARRVHSWHLRVLSDSGKLSSCTHLAYTMIQHSLGLIIGCLPQILCNF